MEVDSSSENWQLFFKNVVEQGVAQFFNSLKTVLKYIGLPFIMAGAAYMQIRMLKEEPSPCRLESCKAKPSKKEDFAASADSDMFVSNIEMCDDWVCWNISFAKEMQHLKDEKLQFLGRKRFDCENSLNLSPDNERQSEQIFDHCVSIHSVILQNKNLDLGNSIVVSYSTSNQGNDNFLCTSESEDDVVDTDEADDTDDTDDECASCDDEDELSISFEDSDDLEVVFDDMLEDSKSSKHTEIPHFLQNARFFNISDGLDELEDICMDKILPCVTKECISVKVADVLNGSDKIGNSDYQRWPSKHSLERSSSPLHITGNLKESNHLNGLKQKTAKKKVSFAKEENLVTVHPMIKWNFAYQRARKGPWERFACDRFHFQRRVESCEHVLGPMLERKYNQYLNGSV